MSVVYGLTVLCNNCGEKFNLYNDFKGTEDAGEDAWYAGSMCPTCSTYRTAKITKANGFKYEIGD